MKAVFIHLKPLLYLEMLLSAGHQSRFNPSSLSRWLLTELELQRPAEATAFCQSVLGVARRRLLVQMQLSLL